VVSRSADQPTAPQRGAGVRPDRQSSPAAARASAVAGKAPGDADFASAWEKYVQDFIAKYELNAEQQERAMKILKSCQQQGHMYLRKRQPQIEKLDRQIAELREASDKDKVAQRSKLEAERRSLAAGVNEIFEKQLKPRLERIPTRAQREAAQKGGRRGPLPGPKTPVEPVPPSPEGPQPVPQGDEPQEEPGDGQ